VTTTPIDKLKPQARNANRHTQRGMGSLERSVQGDGWIGAISAAADGEVFDGSARLEVAGATGFEDAIVVDSDGTKPVVVRRTDIPTADDPRAVRLGLAANRVAEQNLDWDAGLLMSLGEDVDLSAMWLPDELEDMAAQATVEAEIEDGLEGGNTNTLRQLGDKQKQIKPVIYADEVAVFEQALKLTGVRNRGQALIAVCRAYVDNHAV
jgi:hypothetical protein